MNPASIQVPGCRHDVLGHHLKAIGLLRVLSQRDPEAEGWWDLDGACFHVRSEKYPTEDDVARFFAEDYRPTPMFSPWNTGGGLDEKQDLVLRLDRTPVARFLWSNRKHLRKHGFKAGRHRWKEGRLAFDLKGGPIALQPPPQLEFSIEPSAGKKPRQRAVLQWTSSVKDEFSSFLKTNLEQIKAVASLPKQTGKKIEDAEFKDERLSVTVKSREGAESLVIPNGIVRQLRIKTSGEKATLAVLQMRMASDGDITSGIESGRKYFQDFQDAATFEQTREVLEQFRDELPAAGSLAMDAVLTAKTARSGDNPIFLDRGKGGNSEVFRSFWSCFLSFKANPSELVRASLFSRQPNTWDKEKSPGTPFFPDAIKMYNNGLGWVVETFPFNALDYILAVEGALTLRGAVSRTLAANSRRFAAFPFVFDSGEDLVDDTNDVRGTASSVWLPLWSRPSTLAELSSFICDAQARLPGKEARLSAEFARAVRAYGVDAGVSGWQEFRFKMKASRVPWVCSGRYLGKTSNPRSIQLNDALAPLDESGFLDQFEPKYKGGGKIDARSPHPIRASIGAAIEDCIAEPNADNALEILLRLFPACAKLAQSKSFRETLRPPGDTLFSPLPQEPWIDLLHGLDTPEFRIARALASIVGSDKQTDRKTSGAQPFLGSLLPVNLQYGDCRLETSSKQAVWTGTDLCLDLSRVLARRYLDSLADDRPALMSPRPARLEDALAFLSGALDEQRIARWTEALSLIGWHWERVDVEASAPNIDADAAGEDVGEPAVPLAYAALRALIEVECEWQGSDRSLWKKRRSHRPIALLCQRSPSSLSLAVEDALRWLSIWGVPNRWGEAARRDKPRLGASEVLRLDHADLNFRGALSDLVPRLAAAALIPIDWRGRHALYRAVTIPPSGKR